MARMPSKRWVEMVERERLVATIGILPTKVIRCDDAAMLLSRQHAAFVRLVKKLPSFNCYDIKEKVDYRVVRLDTILAALQKGKP